MAKEEEEATGNIIDLVLKDCLSLTLGVYSLQSHSARLPYYPTTERGALPRSKLLGARPGENHSDNDKTRGYSDLFDIARRYPSYSAYIPVSVVEC